MSSFFTLTLDTTCPQIEIIAPSYTTQQDQTEIVVEANENLSLYQDIYVIDNQGERFDFIFDYQGDHFVGRITFNQIALGMVTIYAQLQDEVLNMSDIATKSINVVESKVITIESDYSMSENIIDTIIRDVNINHEESNITISADAVEVINNYTKPSVKINCEYTSIETDWR